MQPGVEESYTDKVIKDLADFMPVKERDGVNILLSKYFSLSLDQKVALINRLALARYNHRLTVVNQVLNNENILVMRLINEVLNQINFPLNERFFALIDKAAEGDQEAIKELTDYFANPPKEVPMMLNSFFASYIEDIKIEWAKLDPAKKKEWVKNNMNIVNKLRGDVLVEGKNIDLKNITADQIEKIDVTELDKIRVKAAENNFMQTFFFMALESPLLNNTVLEKHGLLQPNADPRKVRKEIGSKIKALRDQGIMDGLLPHLQNPDPKYKPAELPDDKIVYLGDVFRSTTQEFDKSYREFSTFDSTLKELESIYKRLKKDLQGDLRSKELHDKLQVTRDQIQKAFKEGKTANYNEQVLKQANEELKQYKQILLSDALLLNNSVEVENIIAKGANPELPLSRGKPDQPLPLPYKRSFFTKIGDMFRGIRDPRFRTGWNVNPIRSAREIIDVSGNSKMQAVFAKVPQTPLTATNIASSVPTGRNAVTSSTVPPQSTTPVTKAAVVPPKPTVDWSNKQLLQDLHRVAMANKAGENMMFMYDVAILKQYIQQNNGTLIDNKVDDIFKRYFDSNSNDYINIDDIKDQGLENPLDIIWAAEEQVKQIVNNDIYLKYTNAKNIPDLPEGHAEMFIADNAPNFTITLTSEQKEGAKKFVPAKIEIQSAKAGLGLPLPPSTLITPAAKALAVNPSNTGAPLIFAPPKPTPESPFVKICKRVQFLYNSSTSEQKKGLEKLVQEVNSIKATNKNVKEKFDEIKQKLVDATSSLPNDSEVKVKLQHIIDNPGIKDAPPQVPPRPANLTRKNK